MHFQLLASLLLTSSALVAALPNSSPVPDYFKDKRAAAAVVCGPSDARPCSLENAQKCANYLIALGNQQCNANQNAPTYYCRIEQCALGGQAVGKASTSSYCKDVGYGAQSIIDKCKNGGKVKGNNSAGGNGNLIIQFRSDV